MDESRFPAPMTTEQAADQSLLTATKLRMDSDSLREVAQGATAEVFGHAGLAQQFQQLLDQFADAMNRKADNLDRVTLAALDAARRSRSGDDDEH